jgi:hypothetical protein
VVHLVQLHNEYSSEGVVVIEVVQSATTAAALQSWSLGNDYNLMRTDPSRLMEMDYGTDQQFLGYPTLPLIDAETMTVLHSDCYTATAEYMGFETMKACVEQFL